MTDNKSLSYLMDIDKVNKEKFSQVISDIENLKTEVSNIKSKVDSSLPVDISSVNTSISDVSGGIADIKQDISTNYTSIIGGINSSKTDITNTINSKMSSSFNFNKKGNIVFYSGTSSSTLVNITGKGRLLFSCFYNLSSLGDSTMTIVIDGISYTTDSPGLSSSGSYIMGGYIAGTAFSLTESILNNLAVSDSSDGVGILSSSSNPAVFISYEPVVFNSSLSVTLNLGGSRTRYASVCYELGV